VSSQPRTAAKAEPHSQAPAPASSARKLVEGPGVLTRPRFRGWIHVYAAGAAVFAGASLVAMSWAVESTEAGLAKG
jgi:hemolysin III